MSDGGDQPQGIAQPPRGLEFLITAQEAYPRLEALFLAAEQEVRMGFRLFDPRTKLRSPAGQAVGETWADLFLHTLNRGVAIDLTVSDFDPVMAHDMHEQAWQFVSIITALNELAEPGAAHMTIRCVLHPAKGGIIPRLMFAAKTRKGLRRVAQSLNGDADPSNRLHFAPGLRGLLHLKEGKVYVTRRALPQLYPITLHHKMAVFDQSITYIGGLDLNERRFDDAEHDQPAQQTWHDVQVISHDPALATAADEYLRLLPEVIDRQILPHPTNSPLRTTLSRRRARNTRHLAPETVSQTLLKTHIDEIERAQHLIYIETQYFRDRRIVSALVKAGKRRRDLRMIVLLPAAPEDVAFSDRPGLDGRFGEYLQARAFRRIRAAFGSRFLAVSPVQSRVPDQQDASAERATLAGAPIIYVHSKVTIFDNKTAIISSANLNGRSMKWDAEAGVFLSDPAQVQTLTNKLQRYWLGEEAQSTSAIAFDAWRARATQNGKLRPNQRKGFIVPHDIKPAARIGTPIPGAPEEMV